MSSRFTDGAAMRNTITRRAALTGAVVSIAALAAPVAAAVRDPEPVDPDRAIAHHAQKLAEALCRKNGGLWHYTLVNQPTINLFCFERADDGRTGTLATFE